MHHGETAHRTGTEGQQGQACDQGGDIGVQNRGPCPVVTRIDGRLRRRAVAQLLSDPLIDQHIRVDRHAQHQGHRRHARQGQGGLQHRQHRHQQQQVERQGDAGKRAKQHVINTHEGDHRQEAPGHAVKTLGDVFRAQAGADGQLLDDLHRRGQRTGAQQQGGVGRLGRGHAP